MDALKILSVLAVIAIHIPTNPALPALPWQIFLQFCRFAVPVFFLISGYLFYGSWQAAPDRALLFQRVSGRIIGLFLFWALFYALIPPFLTGAPHGIADAIGEHFRGIARHPRSFLLTGFAYHLWFLSSLAQAIVVLSLCLRFASVGIAIMIGIAGYIVALAFGPYSTFFFDHRLLNDSRNGPFFSMLFVTLGAWVAAKDLKPSAMCATMLAIGGCLYVYAETSGFTIFNRVAWTNREFSIGTIPFAFGIFLLALRYPIFGSGFASLGAYSLGIYAIHPYLLAWLPRESSPSLSPGLYPVLMLTIFGISIAVVVVISRWKMVRRFVM